jgi:hypothetical protein
MHGMAIWRRRQTDSAGRVPPVTDGLRQMALEAAVSGAVSPGPEHPDVAGVVIDVPAEGGFVTLVALADGSTSMYTSTGGGVIGAGGHAPVAAANRQLLMAAQHQLSTIVSPDDGSRPTAGFVRFHVLTPPVLRAGDVSARAFWGEESHELAPLIAAAQALIAAIREVSP